MMMHERPFATRLLPLTVLTLLSAFCILPSAFSQSATATLTGSVVDQNDAAIPGVTVTLENTSKGLRRQAVTNDEGNFTIPLLQPGIYVLSTAAQGFAPVRISNVVLNVGDQKALQIQLKAGDVNATVQVTSEAPLINESPAVATVVDRRFVENMPLNGRSFQSLIALTPGVVLTKSTAVEMGQFSVNGQRPDANYFTVDGVSANASIGAGFFNGQLSSGSLPGLSAAGGTNNLVSVDALQEFKVLTSTYAPEFGRQPGAQISIATRSGTNEFHGTAFDYFRNDVLDANDWFANSKGLAKPPLRQNDFGGVFGGPVLLPAYNGHNRTFFFVSYEGLQLRQPVVKTTLVPSLTVRQNAVAGIQPFFKAYPLPNGPDRPNGLAEFSASFSNRSELNATSLRIDHAMGGKVTVFGRYNDAPSKNVERGAFGIGTLNSVSSTALNTQTLTFGTVITLTPRLANDLRMNYTRYSGSLGHALDDFGGAVRPSDTVLFPNGDSSSTGQVTFVISGGTNSTLLNGANALNLQRQVNVVDAVSFTNGAHQWKFGLDYRRLFPVFNLTKYNLSISVSSASVAATQGLASTVGVGAFEGNLHPIATNLSAFAQDTWLTTRRLTLTYGLRYEINPAPIEQNGNNQFAVNQVTDLATLTILPRGTALYKTTYNNLAPRVGVAYLLSDRPKRQTVLRGGFGVFYDLGNTQAMNAYSAGGFPFGANKTLSNVLLPLTSVQAAPPVITAQIPSSGQLFATDPGLKLPYTLQWNIAFDQSLGSDQTISATYVGAAGRRLLRRELLRTNPNFAVVNVTRNAATSDYHALQLQFQRRLSRGFQALASYTWSHSLDISSNDSLGDIPIAKVDPRTSRGPSDFDVRHAFNAGITYNIPTWDWKAVGRMFLRDWGIDANITARSATPVDVTISRNLGFGSFTFRPDLVSGVPLSLNDPTAPGGRRFNPAAFTVSPELRQGTLTRNALRGFSIFQTDLALRRQFALNERVKLQFRGDLFNLFNHPNFGDPVGRLGTVTGITLSPNSLFGFSSVMLNRSLGSGGSGGGFSPLYQVGGPRSVQLSLKLMF